MLAANPLGTEEAFAPASPVDVGTMEVFLAHFQLEADVHAVLILS